MAQCYYCNRKIKESENDSYLDHQTERVKLEFDLKYARQQIDELIGENIVLKQKLQMMGFEETQEADEEQFKSEFKKACKNNFIRLTNDYKGKRFRCSYSSGTQYRRINFSYKFNLKDFYSKINDLVKFIKDFMFNLCRTDAEKPRKIGATHKLDFKKGKFILID